MEFLEGQLGSSLRMTPSMYQRTLQLSNQELVIGPHDLS